MAANKSTDNKTFPFIFFRLDWEEINSNEQKDFR